MIDLATTRLHRYIPAVLCTVLFFSFVPPVHALEKAIIQLKWLHHFQFAGYYAALEKGFYKEAGLDVTILEGGPNVEVEQQVVSGRADFGVGTSALLLHRAHGDDLVVLGQIFQHSPAVFLAPRKTGIHSVADMAGRRVMYSNQHGDMLALLKKNGLDENKIVQVPHNGDPQDLISGKADVMIAYSFNEPFVLEQAGESYLTFSPHTYGIDFYGDNLFTTRKLIDARPEFVKAFRDATFRGWRYALSNKSETADLILSKYSKGKNKDWLMFEANQMETLIQPDLVELGYQSPSRWRHISEVFGGLGMLPPGFDPTPIIYAPAPRSDYRLLLGSILVSAIIIAVLSGVTFTFRRLNRRLSAEVVERQRSEEALLKSERKYSSIFNMMPDMVGITKASDGILVEANKGFEMISGWTRDEAIGRSTLELGLWDGDDRTRAVAIMKEKGYVENFEFTFRTKSGDKHPATISLVPIVLEGTDYLCFIVHDITEQKRVEEELRIRNLLLTTQQEVSIDGILAVSESREILSYNQRFAEIWGIPEEILSTRSSKRISDCASERLVHPNQFMEKLTHLYEHQSETSRDELHLKDGLTIDRYSAPMIGEDGRYYGRVWYFRDITDRKRVEEERIQLEKQLLHTQKLESLGVLAGGIAHDFNNILTAIVGNAELALLRLNPESPALEHLHRIEKSAVRATELAKQMLAYSGKGKFVIEAIDLNRLVEEMGHMLEVSISKKAALRFNFTRPLPSIEADVTQVRQIVMNLVINASEAIGEQSGVIAITTGCMECERSYLKDVWFEENIQEGSYVYLEVADTGCGMDKETQARIFDPFFTTKFTGRGLGMAAVLGIVRGHKGAIKVYSEVGKGSSFKILLPASDKPLEVPQSETREESWKGHGRALLVDDEETVRAIGREMLEELGFDVITARDGREALAIFKSRNDIDFVILDLTMPHLDGEQTFRELKLLASNVKVILSSGYSEYEISQKFAGKELAGFIQKPYKLAELREVIRKLDQA